MNMETAADNLRPFNKNQPFDAQRYFSGDEED